MWHDALPSGGIVVKPCPVTEKVEAYTASADEEVAKSDGLPLVARAILLVIILFGIWEIKKDQKKKEA